MEKVITVSQTASEKLPADHVDITFTAAAESKKYIEAALRAEKLADATVEKLTALGIDVRFKGENVSAVRDGKKINAYRAARSYSAGFALKGELLASALDALSSSECEWDTSFSVKDTAATDALISRAVAAAREKAAVIASAAGVKLLSPVSITYESCGAPVMLAYRGAETEEITLSEAVTVVFAID